jgi:hypothetical protein
MDCTVQVASPLTTTGARYLYFTLGSFFVEEEPVGEEAREEAAGDEAEAGAAVAEEEAAAAVERPAE